MSNGTSISLDNGKAQATEQVIDHAVDGICAVGIVVAAATGTADMGVIGGLVSIALGKRVLKQP